MAKGFPLASLTQKTQIPSFTLITRVLAHYNAQYKRLQIFLKKNFVKAKKHISLHSRLIKLVVLLNQITSESSSVGRA